jgi:hypothetical protein
MVLKISIVTVKISFLFSTRPFMGYFSSVVLKPTGMISANPFGVLLLYRKF